MYDLEIIKTQIENIASYCMGDNFEFRPNQLEAIINIIDSIVNKEKHNYVLEAPTGTGKSIINILSAKVLWEFYEIKSHILCSDLSLFQQYEDFLKKYPKFDIPYLKGQTGNFFCSVNGNDVRNGDCKIAQVSWTELMYPISSPRAERKGYHCCKTCEYVINRRKAMEAPIVLTTYQLYMFCMNVPMGSDGNNGQALQPKHVVFCDECHNIPSLVQNQYTPVIVEDDFNKFIQLYNYARDLPDVCEEEGFHPSDGMIYENYPDANDLYDKFMNLWIGFKDKKQSKEDLYNYVSQYSEILDILNLAVNRIQPTLAQKKQTKDQKLTIDEIKMFKLSNWFANYQCFMHDFFCAVEKTSPDYIIKDVNEEEIDLFNTKKTVEIHCVKEDFMVFEFLLRHSLFRVFTSATVGSKSSFDENCGIYFTEDKTSIFEKIPSGFDFSKSPIVFLSRYKMSMREQDKNLPYIKDVIFQILHNKFSKDKGIIQTGSYAIAKKIYDCAPPDIQNRMLLYRGSRDKNDKIELHKILDNTILIGPTLNQGIDLPGDLCRFIIICKVPYPSLGSNLVKAKCELFPEWYDAITSTEIIQGIGRGVRFNGDYCQTYILDGCFSRLYQNTKEQYSPELQARIKIV